MTLLDFVLINAIKFGAAFVLFSFALTLSFFFERIAGDLFSLFVDR